MRKLIFAINTTLEGCVDHTKQIALNKFLKSGSVTLHYIKQITERVSFIRTIPVRLPGKPDLPQFLP